MCERQRNKQRAALAPVIVVAAVVIAGVVAAAVTLNRARARQPAADSHQNTHSAAPAPKPKVIISAPKSLNDLKIRTFALHKQSGGPASTIVGDIENDSENRHRRITVELQVLNAQGMKVETLTATVADLAPHATWHVTSKTLNSYAASVRVGGLKEE